MACKRISSQEAYSIHVMKIALLGDIALFGRMSVNENPNVAAYFSEIADYLKGFDYVVGNLETPFSVEKKTNGAKSAYICSDVENVKTLKHLHINAVCLANNHMFDFGKEGYETTKRVLTENNIEFFGTEGKEVVVTLDGNKLAFNGFCCYTTNPLNCVPYGGYGVNAYNVKTAKNILRKKDKDGYLSVFSVHAGLEHVNYPSIEHIKTARLLADVVPFVYYGHHPHVIQGVEEYEGSLIAHSLGNFCFDDVFTNVSKNKPLIELTENNRTGMVLELTIDDSKVVSWKEQIIHIGQKGDGLHLIDTPLSFHEYNRRLVDCEERVEEYNAQRKAVLDERIAERKAMRNLGWFLKRLRPRYIRLVIDMKKNERLYKENVRKYI